MLVVFEGSTHNPPVQFLQRLLSLKSQHGTDLPLDYVQDRLRRLGSLLCENRHHLLFQGLGRFHLDVESEMSFGNFLVGDNKITQGWKVKLTLCVRVPFLLDRVGINFHRHRKNYPVQEILEGLPAYTGYRVNFVEEQSLFFRQLLDTKTPEVMI